VVLVARAFGPVMGFINSYANALSSLVSQVPSISLSLTLTLKRNSKALHRKITLTQTLTLTRT
jgi:hypothetical protein